MKKNVVLVLLFIFFVLLIKYYISDYEIKYEINDFKITEKYENGRFYFEIENKYVFNFSYYKNRKISKKLINDIKVVEGEETVCIYPVISGFSTYPLCRSNEELISYDLIQDEKIEKFVEKLNIKFEEKKVNNNENFVYNDNIDKNVFIAVWKYDGFYLINKNGVKELTLFETDKYDNSLCTFVKDKLLIPNHENLYDFNSFKLINIKTGKVKTVHSKYEISYDSYVAGVLNNKVYLYDIKYSNLFEINVNKETVKLVGNTEDGYFKIENGKEVKSSKKEYEKKIMFFENDLNNLNVENNYKYYLDNSDILTRFMYEDIKVVKIYKDNIYYIYKDDLYLYNEISGRKVIAHYFEFNFNVDNMVFVYSK